MTKAAASVEAFGEGQEMRDGEVGLGLAFDAGRALGQGQAGDGDAEPLRHGAQRAMAASMPSVTVCDELGLMT
jgi:hypothetical protein